MRGQGRVGLDMELKLSSSALLAQHLKDEFNIEDTLAWLLLG